MTLASGTRIGKHVPGTCARIGRALCSGEHVRVVAGRGRAVWDWVLCALVRDVYILAALKVRFCSMIGINNCLLESRPTTQRTGSLKRKEKKGRA